MTLQVVDQITGPLRSITSALERVRDVAQRINGGAGNTRVLARSFAEVAERARAATSAIGGLAARTTALGAVAGAGGLVAFNQGFVNLASNFEQLRAQLDVATGSAQRGGEAFEWIRETAARTPYTVGEVADSFVRLQSAGFDATRFFQSIGNAAAGMRRPLSQAAEAFTDAAMGEFERLKEFGIQVQRDGERLVFNYAINGQRFQRVIANASQDRIAAELSAIWNARHEGAMETLARTWSGMLSNLQDAFDRFRLAIMESGVFQWMKDQLQQLLDRIGELQADGTLARWAEEIGQRVTRAFQAMRDFMIGTDEQPGALQRIADAFRRVRDVVQPLVDRFGGAEAALIGIGLVLGGGVIASVASLAAAVATLGLVMVATPAGWFLGILAGLATAAVLIVRNWQPLGEWFEGLLGGIVGTFKDAWDFISDILARIGGALGRLTGSGEGALTQPAAQGARRVNWRDRGGNIGFQLPPGIAEMERNAGEAAQLAARPAQQFDAGGQLNIRIDLENLRAQAQARANDPSMRFSVNQGLSMVGP